jgi:hypothetical protein
MKIVVIGGTDLIGSKGRCHSAPDRPRVCRRLAQKRYQQHSPAMGSGRPWPAPKWLSTSPIRLHLKTRWSCDCSRPAAATFSRQMPRQTSGSMSGSAAHGQQTDPRRRTLPAIGPASRSRGLPSKRYQASTIGRPPYHPPRLRGCERASIA